MFSFLLCDSDNQMMTSNKSPKKRARLDSSDEGSNSNADQIPDEENEDDVSFLTSQPSHDPWQRWSIQQVEEELVRRDIPEDAVQKFKGEHL